MGPKPCPCCGAPATIRYHRELDAYGVRCTQCFLEVTCVFGSPEAAARHWDRRHSPAPPQSRSMTASPCDTTVTALHEDPED